jgi:methionyl aminopeptidase
MDQQKIIKAGEIFKEVKDFILPKIKKGVKLVEVANLIEEKIYELGGEPAFPVNLSINEIAAHYTPRHDDETEAHGLLKVDFGVHVDGWVADSAFSIDLEGSEVNKKLIEASEKALEAATKKISSQTSLGEIGSEIEETISSYGFNPVSNLSGHSMEQYDLHAGISVPNVSTGSGVRFGEGLYAIEPFATNGKGQVHDGVKGNIYLWVEDRNTRLPFAREVLNFIKEEYGDLPFASRWIVKKFGQRALLSLSQLEREGILHHYPVLTEEKGKLVAQAESTFLIKKDEVIVTTG